MLVAGINCVQIKVVASGRIELVLEHACDIAIGVYDVTGRHITTLAEGRMAAGKHTIEWPQRSGVAMAPGLYFVRMTGSGVNMTRRVVVLGGM